MALVHDPCIPRHCPCDCVVEESERQLTSQPTRISIFPYIPMIFQRHEMTKRSNNGSFVDWGTLFNFSWVLTLCAMAVDQYYIKDRHFPKQWNSEVNISILFQYFSTKENYFWNAVQYSITSIKISSIAIEIVFDWRISNSYGYDVIDISWSSALQWAFTSLTNGWNLINDQSSD